MAHEITLANVPRYFFKESLKVSYQELARTFTICKKDLRILKESLKNFPKFQDPSRIIQEFKNPSRIIHEFKDPSRIIKESIKNPIILAE